MTQTVLSRTFLFSKKNETENTRRAKAFRVFLCLRKLRLSDVGFVVGLYLKGRLYL